MERNRLVGVTGVTGVGKDFLTQEANTGLGLLTLNIGTLVGRNLATDRDLMMGSADPVDIYRAQMSAYQEAVVSQPAIVTCHAVRQYPHGLDYRWEMEQVFNPELYVFIKADPELIASRVEARNARGERQCEMRDTASIEQEQLLKLKRMEELTGKLGCGLVVIDNSDQSTAESVQIMKEAIAQIAS